MSVTQEEIARKAGVSQSAVAFAFSDEPSARRHLRPQTRQRVLAVARRWNYVPHQAARNLRLGRTQEIVFATESSLRYAYVHNLIEELQAALSARRYRLDLELYREVSTAPALYRTFTRGRCDGVILNGVHPEYRPAVESLQRQGMPVVVTNALPEWGVDTVDYDRPESARLGTAHLLAQGHRRVALIVHGRGLAGEEQRVQGYRRALAEAGVAFDESLILTGNVGADLQPLWQRLAGSTPRPTAIVCCNAEMSLQWLGMLHRQGLRVPEEIALVSLGDAPVNTLAEVPLTAVDTNPRGVATAIAERLLERIAHPHAPGQHIVVQPFLVERESSRKQKP